MVFRAQRSRGEKLLNSIRDQMDNYGQRNISIECIIIGPQYHDNILEYMGSIHIDTDIFVIEEIDSTDRVLETIFGIKIIVMPFEEVMVLPDNRTTLMNRESVGSWVRGLP